MLLFLLSFYLHYDLFNCDENEMNAKFNETLIIDKHHQNLLQVNDFLKDVQKKIVEKSPLIIGDYGNETTKDKEFIYDNITNWRRSKAPGIDYKKLATKFIPSPQYDPFDRRQGLFHFFPPDFPGFKVPLPPLVMTRPSPLYPKGLFPLKNPRQRPGLPYPGYLLRPVHSLYPRVPPGFLSDYRYQNIYLRPPVLYMPSPTYTAGYIYPQPLNPLLPAISTLISDSASRIPPPVTILSSTIFTPTMGQKAKIWLQEISPYIPNNEKFKKPSKDLSAPHGSVKTTLSIDSRTSEINDYSFSTKPANTEQLFNENEHGAVYVSLPEKDGIPDQIPNDPNKDRISTTAGDVLHEKTSVQETSTPLPKPRYLDLMEQLHEGYMMVFMIELCRMIAVKDKWEVREVLHHTEMIYNSLWDNGRLAWIGDPLETVIWKLSIIMSGRDIDLVRTYASMMFHMLLERKQALSAEVNSIIDEADLFYNHDEGDRLLYSLKQFQDYPRTTKNSYWLCDSLIVTFLLPFRRLAGTRRRQRLIDSINKVLKQRFPLLLEEHNEETLSGKASPNNEFKPRKSKLHHLSHKKKRKRKRHRTPEYNNKNYRKQHSQDIDFMEYILRTTPVTDDLPRFRVTVTKSYRKKRLPTTVYFNILTLSTRYRKPGYQQTSLFQKKLDFYDRKKYKSTKKTVHPYRQFSRKSSNSEQRSSPSFTISSYKKKTPFQDKINPFNGKNYKSTVRKLYHRHHFSRKTTTAGHRPPPNVATSDCSVLLASSGLHSSSRTKQSRIEKIPFYQMKEKLRESETKQKDRRLKLKADLLIKITESSSYGDEEVPLTKNLNETLKCGNRSIEFVDETR